MLSKLSTILLQPRNALSSARSLVGHRTRSLSLGRKLLVAFLSLAAMAGLCGAVGLIFFERIAGSVSVLSQINSPMLIESIALIDNVDRMRSVVLETVSHTDASQDQLATLTRLDDEGREHANRLRVLSMGVGLWSRFEPVEQLREDFVATLQDILKARTPKTKADNAVSERYSQVRTRTLLADGEILGIGRRFEDKSTESDLVSKADFQELQATYHLTHETARVYDLAQAVVSAGGELDLALLEADAQRLFMTISALRHKLPTLARTPERQGPLASIELSLEALQAGFLGVDGLIAQKRVSLTATARVTARLKKLSEIEIRYLDVLTGVASAVRGGNETSMARTTNTITQGRVVIMVVVALSALLGVAAAVFLKSSITGPLDSLTTHVRAIRARGDLIAISDRILLESPDELGDLSRSFNGMIAELAETRRQLIARSEAEITRQVERLEAALANMSQGLCMFDPEQRLVVTNQRYRDMYGLSTEQARPGVAFRDLLQHRVERGSFPVGSPLDAYIADLLASLARGSASAKVTELADGRFVAVSNRPMPGGGWVATHEDITDRRRAEGRITHLAHHDGLTDLPNRALLRERLEQAVTGMREGDRCLAVLMLDLDRFKEVNDRLGHSVGDALLKAVTGRLRSCVRETDTIARLGGDEFAILQRVTEPATETAALAKRIQEVIAAPFDLDDHHVTVGTSIGIAMAPGDGTDPDQLMKNADLALYRSKSEGRGTYRFFEPEMDQRMQARRSLERDLRNALINCEFALHYQPLVNIERDEICGFEALLRWTHPERGKVAPADFIPLAEEMGLIVPIGEWVLRQACTDAATWPKHLKIAVNVSVAQFKSRNLVELIVRTLAATGIAPQRLELEITESVMFQDREGAFEILTRLHDLGVRIALDDFGTGYSSLSNLRKFPFDKIKIDRSFVSDLSVANIDALAVVRSIAHLGVSLGMSTTAEGVETKEQMDQVRAEGCTEMQGFLFSKAVPAEEIERLFLGPARKSVSAA